MYVLRHHFNDNTTILIHDWVIIGGERFKMEGAPAILEKLKVPAKLWQQVLDVYTGVSTPEQIESFKDDSEGYIRREVARLGLYPEQFKGDSDWRVRLAVAKLGLYPEQLKDDPDTDVRREVAKLGLYPEQFKDDPEWYIRLEVAKLGLCLEQLKDDSDWRVRLETTKHIN